MLKMLFKTKSLNYIMTIVQVLAGTSMSCFGDKVISSLSSMEKSSEEGKTTSQNSSTDNNAFVSTSLPNYMKERMLGSMTTICLGLAT